VVVNILQVSKRFIIELVDWLLFKTLKTKQKQFLSHLMTKKQKEIIKKMIHTGTKRVQLKKIELYKYRLLNLGFYEKGLEDLEEIIKNSQDAYQKRLAAWELALWHANQYSEESAKRCQQFLSIAVEGEKDKELLRRAAVLMAECYQILGDVERGKQVIKDALEWNKHPDLYLAAANLETSLPAKVQWINKVFDYYKVENINIHIKDQKSPYDSMTSEPFDNRAERLMFEPKVTVIIPVYNAQDVIETSLTSVLRQSWRNLEIFVVDDGSTDRTSEIVAEFARKDSRIQFIQSETNSGAYVSRNLALQKATGEFVTINDADDWSHPRKIETQIEHLLKNPKVIGNFSQQARATNDLKFFRRGKPGMYMFSNMSSFMFKRKPVLEKIGYWDSVRFGGDSEFIKRIKLVFGEKSVVELPTAPLSFQRQSIHSLTGHSAFGFPGYFMGARKEYKEAHERYHQDHKEDLYYPFPMEKRPFAIPEPMLPVRKEKSQDGRRHFDVIIASEFRLLGGTNMSNIEEIKAQTKMGLRTGLIQLSRYDLNTMGPINPKVRDMIDGEQVEMLVYGEKVSCDVLIVRHPPILQEWQRYLPDVKAKSVHVIVNQPPKRDYSDSGQTLYNINRCMEHLVKYFGTKGKWYPIGPQVREVLNKYHREELFSVPLADEDWVNIINVSEWRRPNRPKNGSKIKIGRHSRDQYVKWPCDREELLSIYPDSEPYEVQILGGAKSPRKVLGQIPSNWKVYEFGEFEPREFLAGLDVFVYYTHPDWVEAFGRVIFEAMAVGVPVIVPPSYQSLFGDVAIYAEPHEVRAKIEELMSDDEYYQQVVERAYHYVEKHFGYSKHASRLGKFLNGQ
jgi:glycosyltransferase involved in cell wall biosynthesis